MDEGSEVTFLWSRSWTASNFCVPSRGPDDQSGPGDKLAGRFCEQKATGACQQLSEEAEEGWSARGVTSEAV